MDFFVKKIFLSLLISSFVCHREVNSLSNCPSLGTNLTNGVRAELITANDGMSLLGIRVLWTIKAEFLNCQFLSLRVELNSDGHDHQIVISGNDSSADFYNPDCNRNYTPSVHFRLLSVPSLMRKEDGDGLFYGGTINSGPSQLSRICVGRGLLGRLNISWDLLPCYLQNGADITTYKINYTYSATNGTSSISSSTSAAEQLICGIKSSRRYGCLFGSSVLETEVQYTFQVAAVNSYGTGPFSDPIIGMFGIQDVIMSSCVSTEVVRDVTTATNTSTLSEGTHNNLTTVTVTDIDDNISQLTDVQHSTNQQFEAWIIAGILVVIVIILAGVIIVLITFNYIFWKRVKLSKTQQSQLNESEMDMKECLAYGHVTSTITTSAEEQHVYESAK